VLQPAPTKVLDVNTGNAVSMPTLPSPSRTLDSNGGALSPEETKAETHFSYLTHADDDFTHASAYRAVRRRERDERAALARADKTARMEEVLTWTLYRKMDGGLQMQHRVHNRKEIGKWFMAATRDHPDGNDRVKASDLVDTLISLGLAQSKKQVQRVFVKLKARADSDGLLDQNAFCDALEKDFKIQPKTNFGLEDGEEGNNKGVDLLQIPTRLALHRRHVIMSALRSHSVLDEDIGHNESSAKLTAKGYTDVVAAKNPLDTRRRRTARALQQAPSWLLQQDLHDAGFTGESTGDSSVADESGAPSSGMWYDDDPNDAEEELERARALSREERMANVAFLASQGQKALQRERDANSRDHRMAAQSKDYDVMGRRWKDIRKGLKPPITAPKGAVLEPGWTPYPKRTGPRPGPPLKFPAYRGACIRKDFPKKPEELERYQKKTMRRVRMEREKQNVVEARELTMQQKKAQEPKFQISVHQYDELVPSITAFDLDAKMKRNAKTLQNKLLSNDTREWSSSPTRADLSL
jgi:hypothetical protein